MSGDSGNLSSRFQHSDSQDARAEDTADSSIRNILSEQRKQLLEDSETYRDAWTTVEEFLEQFPDVVDDSDGVIDLIYNEFLLRCDQDGAEVDISSLAQEYLTRFPHYAEDLENQFQYYVGIQAEAAAQSRPNSPPLPGPGSVIHDEAGAPRYRILSALGEGGFAVVFRAQDQRLKRSVAIKVAKVAVDLNSAQYQRFTREAESAAQLSHPSLVSVHEIGYEAGRPFIVQQLMRGGSLADRMKGTPIDHNQAVEWLIPVCQAIEFAHGNGIVHRDIKPANILFDQNDRPHVADFGLASRPASDLTLTKHGDLLGTPVYMPPEQIRNEKRVGPSSDVYSLGVVLYEMICGNRPFQGSATNVLHQTIHDEPSPPRRLNPQVPVDLETICLKAMSKTPGDRYPSAIEMANDLSRFVNFEPIKARRIGPIGRMWRFCQRQRVFVGTLVVSLLIIVAIAVAGFLRVVEERDRFRAERDRANRELYESLIANSANHLKSRQTGWYQSSMDSLGAAAELDFPGKDVSRQRELMIETLASTNPRFEVVSVFQEQKNAVISLALNAELNVLVASYDDGSLLSYRFNLDGEGTRIETPTGTPVSDLEFSAEGETLFGLCEGRLWSWKFEPSKGPGTVEFSPPNATRFRDLDAFALSSRGMIAVAGTERGIEVFRTSEGEIGDPVSVIELEKAKVNDLEFDRTGNHIDAALGNAVYGSWMVETGLLVHRRIAVAPIRHLTTTGQTAVTSDRVSHRCEFWEYGGQLRPTDQASSPVVRLGNVRSYVVAATSGGKLLLFEKHGSHAPATMSSGLGEITSLATNRFGDELFAGYRDGAVRKWKILSSRFVEGVDSLVGELVSDGQTVWGPWQKIQQNNDGKNDICYANALPMKSIQLGRKSGVMVWGHGKNIVIRKPGGEVLKIRDAFESSIQRTCISPDEKFIAAHDATGTVRIWAFASLEVVQEIPVEQIFALAMTNRNVLVACGRGTFAQSTETVDEIHWLSEEKQARVSMDCNENRLAICSNDGFVEVLEADTWKPIHQLGHRDGVRQVLFNEFNEFNEFEEEKEGKLGGGDSERGGGKLSWQIVSLGHDNTLRFWDEEGIEVRSIAVEAGACEVAIDPLEQWLVFNFTNKFAQIYDFKTGKRRGSLADTHLTDSDSHRHFCFSHDGNELFCINKSLVCFERKDFQPTPGTNSDAVPYRVIVPGFHIFDTYASAVSADGRWHVGGGHDRHVYVRDQELKNVSHVLGDFSSTVWCAAFSPDSKWLAVGSEREGRGELSFWSTENWICEKTIPFGTRLISSIAFHPDKPLLAVSNFDGKVALIDPNLEKVVAELLPVGAATMHVEFNRKGDFLVAASTSNGSFGWPLILKSPDGTSEEAGDCEVVVGERIQIEDPGEMIWGISFAMSDQQLVTVSESGKVKFYAFPELNRIVTLDSGQTRLRKVAFANEGDTMVLSIYGLKGQVWNLKSLRQQLATWQLDW